MWQALGPSREKKALLRTLFIFAALPLLLAIASCSDEGGDLPTVEGYALSPDETVLRYRRSFVSSDVAQLGRILHPEFVFEMHPDDADSLETGLRWGYDEELAIANRIFDRENGVRVDGSCQPPPDSQLGLVFTFDNEPLNEPTVWLPVDEGPLRGSLRREFGIRGQLLDANGLLDFMRGRQAIYVRDETVAIDGRCCERVWKIVGWDDLGVNSTLSKHGKLQLGPRQGPLAHRRSNSLRTVPPSPKL